MGEFISQCPTSMHGSGEIHTCYFYRRLSTPASASSPATGCSKIVLPPRPATDDKAITVVTADSFKKCVVDACGPLETLKNVTARELESFLSSGRPKREKTKKYYQCIDFDASSVRELEEAG